MVIAYVYAPGNKIRDEPVVQTKDNSTYLDKTFEGRNGKPYMGQSLWTQIIRKILVIAWLGSFGHARGSKVADNRMFNDVNFYDNQRIFDQHKYVVETPERKFYYEAMGLVVPEETAFIELAWWR